MNPILILDDDDDLELEAAKTPAKKKKKATIGDKTYVHEIVDVECFTPKPRTGTSKSDAIPVEQDAYDRDLNRAIKASLFESTLKGFIDLTEDDDDRRRKRSKPFSNPLVTEIGQSSKSQISAAADDPFVCEICVEPKSQNESFSINGCSHSYCADCVSKYVASKLQDNVTNIRCPVSGWSGLLEPENCRRILPAEVFDRWGDALCEAVIVGDQKLYCPYKDCSALFINDDDDDDQEGELIKECNCPFCKRKFCAQCKVPWHDKIDCEEFQKLGENERAKEDILLLKLAKSKNWARCPRCNIYVQKISGCDSVYCRCGTSFHYGYNSVNNADSKNHDPIYNVGRYMNINNPTFPFGMMYATPSINNPTLPLGMRYATQSINDPTSPFGMWNATQSISNPTSPFAMWNATQSINNPTLPQGMRNATQFINNPYLPAEMRNTMH